VLPVLTPEEMGGVDRSAPEPVEVLIGRAGRAVALAARRMLGRSYGARVVVVAGKGNNGADGRAAAALLRRAGVAVTVIDAGALGPGQQLPPTDLVIDAAYGSGISRAYVPPDPGHTPVLAVDIASGLSGLTGQVVGGPDGSPVAGGATGPSGPGSTTVRATATVTFAALKPGHLLGSGPERCGPVEVADIGLDRGVSAVARAWLVTDADVRAGLPGRPADAHKWQSALAVVAGSPGMTGAPWLVCRTAMRAGAGYVRLGVPGAEAGSLGLPPGELVAVSLPAHAKGDDGWVEVVLADLDRFSALVVGPGLGPAAKGADGSTGADTPVGHLIRRAEVPVVIDADGLNALGSLDALAEVAADRRHPTVITPHAGEYARLAGGPPGVDRLAAVREAAVRSGVTVLLKGSTTVVADPGGRVLLSATGSSALASAGTGDALSGVVGAFLARGLQGQEAAAFAAHVHGRAAGMGRAQGLVASDLPELVADWLSLDPPSAPAAGGRPGR
jgi:hydroxyethylthiazole kinase-like uncharacterized protein yjeF